MENEKDCARRDPIGQAQKADVWRQAPASAAVRAWVVLKL